jgi:hypothetical protein
MRELKYIDLENVYGYPSLSPTFIKWLKARGNVQLVIALHNLEKVERTKEFIIVVTGLPYLESCGVPILGYNCTEVGLWHRGDLPTKLRPNKVHILLPKFQGEMADTKTLYNLYVNDVMSETFSPRFTTYHTTECLNDRVFRHKRKT